jgi:hypothetical protein
VHPFVALMRTYCIDYTNSHDQSLYDEIMEPDYVVHINGMDLVRSSTYSDSVTTLFDMAPGLGLVVHELVLNGDRLCMSFSEHGAFPGDGRATAGLLARHRPLQVERPPPHRELRRAGLPRHAHPARIGRGAPPHPAPPRPWVTTQPVPADPAAEEVVRAWLGEGDLAAAEAVEIDDGRTGVPPTSRCWTSSRSWSTTCSRRGRRCPST